MLRRVNDQIMLSSMKHGREYDDNGALFCYSISDEQENRRDTMSDYVPGTLYNAERDMNTALRERHQRAEVRRLQRQLKGGSRLQRFYFDVLASLGHRLASWGERLQERYGSETSAQAMQSV
jgi:hypothetical protein